MTPMNSVLIVDDERPVRDIMSRWAKGLGLDSQTADSAEEALAALRTYQPDMAIIDVMMPGHDGLWLATRLQRDHPHTAVVIATGRGDMLEREAPDATTTQRGIADFLIKPLERERFELAVDRGRQWRKETLEERRWNARLAFELRDRTNELCAMLRERTRGASEFDMLTTSMRDRVPEVVAHSERVARFSLSIARALEIPGEACDVLETAAKMHDVGKAAMPEALVTKPSSLTTGETAIMRRHVDAGAEILSATESLAGAAPIVLASHEQFGGAGYPRQLAGSAIPLASRIIAVADAYDAMTQDRAYRRHLDSFEAVAELRRGCSKQFDPTIVDAFLSVLGRH